MMRVHPFGPAGGGKRGWLAGVRLLATDARCWLPTLSEGATDMDGPSLAPILIPVIGTLLLIACLAIVFLAGRHAHRPAARD